MTIAINNPLPEALKHYQVELIQTLNRINLSTKISGSHPVENMDGVTGQAVKLVNAIRNSNARRTIDIPIVQIWPSMGLLEPFLWKTSSRNRHSIIFHDPVPIRKQIGFDRFSKALASRFDSNKAPRLLVHSRDAMTEIEKLYPFIEVELALHPVLTDMETPSNEVLDIIVAGQFKPERDLNLLSTIGPSLRAMGLRPRIFGRGWPDTISGWEIESRFLSEAELDASIDNAAIVLIPYKNYFQSGIAIRALERGRPVVSPENSFTQLIYGQVEGAVYPADSSPAQVMEHIRLVLSNRYNAQDTFSRYRRLVDESWINLLH